MGGRVEARSPKGWCWGGTVLMYLLMSWKSQRKGLNGRSCWMYRIISVKCLGKKNTVFSVIIFFLARQFYLVKNIKTVFSAETTLHPLVCVWGSIAHFGELRMWIEGLWWLIRRWCLENAHCSEFRFSESVPLDGTLSKRRGQELMWFSVPRYFYHPWGAPRALSLGFPSLRVWVPGSKFQLWKSSALGSGAHCRFLFSSVS